MWFKKIKIPDGCKELEAVQLWEVRWKSRCGPYGSDLESTSELFTSERDAKAFSEALKDAYKLVRNTGPESEEIKIISRNN